MSKGGFLLLLCLFKNNALAERWVELNQFDLALDALAILARPIDIARLRGLELYEIILRHSETLPAFESLSKNSHFGLTSTRGPLFDVESRLIVFKRNGYHTPLNDPM